MPWTSVRNNVLFPLRHKKLAREERTRLVEGSLAAVDPSRFGDHNPWQLSGGMHTRGAMARSAAACVAVCCALISAASRRDQPSRPPWFK